MAVVPADSVVDDLSGPEHLEDLALAGRLSHPLRLDNHAITDAAAELLSQYRQHDVELEARLGKAEAASVAALLAESECRSRLIALEATVKALAPVTTTVQVTHQVPTTSD